MKTRKAPKKATAEVISIGNELLIGHTLDTNSHWIAKQLNRVGWSLQRVTQIQDSINAIKSAVGESLKRRPTVIVTVGGLGPTHDDLTLKGVSLAIGKPLRLNRDALLLVKEHYRRLERNPSLTKYRTKMATLPRGSSPLPNPVGTAPGVYMSEGPTALYSLPGVPSEMKAIFRTSILPSLKTVSANRPTGVQFKIAGIIESALAPILDQARRAYPGLYFKSHPRGREDGVRPLILLHIYNVQLRAARDVDDAAEFIVRRVAETVSNSKTYSRAT